MLTFMFKFSVFVLYKSSHSNTDIIQEPDNPPNYDPPPPYPGSPQDKKVFGEGDVTAAPAAADKENAAAAPADYNASEQLPDQNKEIP